MSDLRDRCRERVEMILADDVCLSEVECNIVQRHLETFSKNEHIKGMEAVQKEVSRRLSVLYAQLKVYDDDNWIVLNAKIRSNRSLNNWIDAEIAKLKEGSPDA